LCWVDKQVYGETKDTSLPGSKEDSEVCERNIGSWNFIPYTQKNIEGEVFGYSDSDWCGDKDDRKSTAGYVFKFGTSPIS